MSETDMTDHPELREAVERYKRGESLNAAAVNSLVTPDRIDALLRERDALVKDAARLKHLEDTGLNLVNDDDGRWAVSDTGLQPVRPTGGFTDTADILCSVYPDNWKDSIREAIDYTMQKDCYEEA